MLSPSIKRLRVIYWMPLLQLKYLQTVNPTRVIIQDCKKHICSLENSDGWNKGERNSEQEKHCRVNTPAFREEYGKHNIKTLFVIREAYSKKKHSSLLKQSTTHYHYAQFTLSHKEKDGHCWISAEIAE